MSLSGSLRNKTYTYALGGHLFGRPRRSGEPLDQHTISPLLVCRQIHNEARDFLFKYNTFPIHCSDRKSSLRTTPPAYSFESLNQKQRELICSVRLDLGDCKLWKLSRPLGNEESTAAEESEEEALSVIRRACLDLLVEVRGSLRSVVRR